MINCIGTLTGSSGYASHFRGVVNELNKLEDCKIVTNLPVGFEKEVNDNELKMLKREQDFDINLIITHPLYWRSNLSAKRNFVYLVWEGDSVPAWMCKECYNNNIEKIIVPSKHTYNALKKGFEEYDPDGWLSVGDEAGKNKVVIIPHGYNPKDFYPKMEAIEIDENDKPVHPNPPFKFLANKGFRNLEDRGGIQYLIKAYIEEFKPEENVELVLKVNPAYGIPNLLELFPELKGKIPKITYIPENYTTKKLNELYNECDVFVSPTRAEAFNLPCLEAMACGLPVITTNYGGQTDYVPEGGLIDYDLVEVKHEVEYEGIRWAIPKMADLKQLMRKFFDKQDSIPDPNFYKSIAAEYTWENTAKLIFDNIYK